MDHPTLIEGARLVVGLLILSPIYAWFWRERTPKLEPPAQPATWRCVFTQRSGHTFVVVFHDDNYSEAISALCNIAVASRTPLTLADAERLADAMEARVR